MVGSGPSEQPGVLLSQEFCLVSLTVHIRSETADVYHSTLSSMRLEWLLQKESLFPKPEPNHGHVVGLSSGPDSPGQLCPVLFLPLLLLCMPVV